MHFCGMEDKRGQMSSTQSLGLASDICLFKLGAHHTTPEIERWESPLCLTKWNVMWESALGTVVSSSPVADTCFVLGRVASVLCLLVRRELLPLGWEGLENSHTCVWQQGQIP